MHAPDTDTPDKIERLACLYLAFLNNPAGLSFSQIYRALPLAYQGEFESARRKFERDKEDLASLGMPLRHFADGEPMPDGRTALGHVYVPIDAVRRMPEVTMTEDEASALAFVLFGGISAAEDSDPPMAEIYRSAASKLLYRNRSALPDAAPDPAPALPSRKTEDAELSVLARAHEAILARRAIRFHYPATDGTVRQRIVEGRGLVMHRGRWGLVAFCRAAKGMRVFYADRIEGAEVLPERYALDPSFKIENYSLHALSVRTHPEVRVTVEVIPGKEEAFQDFLAGLRGSGPQGSLWHVTTTNLEALFSWMIRNPGAVRRLGPEEVRSGFENRLKEMKALYAE